MFYPFFALAAVSPGRQIAFRCLACVHVGIVGIMVLFLQGRADLESLYILGHVLLVAGIVEGALLLGWRLTQLPKSQALEFVFVSPLHPSLLFLAEIMVGVARLALVTLAGLPLLLSLVLDQTLYPIDVLPLLWMPLLWGTITGLGLTAWAYEPATVRRWGE